MNMVRFFYYKKTSIKNVTFFSFLVGIGWDTDIFKKSEFDLETSTINLQISCNNTDIFTLNLTEERRKAALGFCLMILTLPAPENWDDWENFPCPMSFDNLSYSWLITGSENKQNEEFGLAVENAIIDIYKKSYAFKYYNLEVRNENGVVFFYNNSKKQIHNSNRFIIQLKIPDKTKTYFKQASWWNSTFGSEWPEWVPAQKLSNISNGTLSNDLPETQSHLYIPPFSVSFRSQGIEQNFLGFNRFNTPNLDTTILTMMVYDSSTNTLFPFFDPHLFIPYHNNIPLTQDLEFKILDSNRNHVHISDNSQLFFILTLL